MRTFCALAVLCALTAGFWPAAAGQARSAVEEKWKQGHSRHGEAFDVGPREKPWRIEGSGNAHFAVTASKPEVQVWFDQGHSLLHSFWYYHSTILIDRRGRVLWARSGGDPFTDFDFLLKEVRRANEAIPAKSGASRAGLR